MATIANNHPIPEPKPYTADSVTVEKSFCCINNDPPRIAQLTAIKGKNIPKALYNAGAKRSTIISTNCTIEAITAINNIKLRKLRSIDAYSGPNQTRAPSFKMYVSNR